MLNSQKTAIDSTRAEVLTSQSNLAVSSLIYVLDKPITTVKATPDTILNALSCLRQLVIPTTLDLFVDVFENDADEPDQRGQE